MSFDETRPGSHGTLGGTREPGLQRLVLPLAYELDEVLVEVDRLSHFRMLGVQLGELLGFVLGALLLMPHHQSKVAKSRNLGSKLRCSRAGRLISSGRYT
jgi:hypothetical protein